MPGSEWQLDCPGCSARYWITTGAAVRPGKEPTSPVESFHYEQMTCPRHPSVVSVIVRSGEESERCPDCGSPYEKWSGFAGIRPIPGRAFGGVEVVEGPCPCCGTALEAKHLLLWD